MLIPAAARRPASLGSRHGRPARGQQRCKCKCFVSLELATVTLGTHTLLILRHITFCLSKMPLVEVSLAVATKINCTGTGYLDGWYRSQATNQSPHRRFPSTSHATHCTFPSSREASGWHMGPRCQSLHFTSVVADAVPREAETTALPQRALHSPCIAATTASTTSGGPSSTPAPA
jgi:hypothetical protein